MCVKCNFLEGAWIVGSNKLSLEKPMKAVRIVLASLGNGLIHSFQISQQEKPWQQHR